MSATATAVGPGNLLPATVGPANLLPATDSSQLLALVVAKRVLDEVAGGDFSTVDRERVSVILGASVATELTAHLSGRLGRPVWERALRRIGCDDEQVAQFSEIVAASYAPWQESSFPGLLNNVIAGRVANRLDLHGTNCSIDWASLKNT